MGFFRAILRNTIEKYITIASLFFKNKLDKINSSKKLKKTPHQFAAVNEFILSNMFS